MQAVENYDVDSICVYGVKSLSFSCGTYITKPVVPLCIQQTTYTQNDNNQYIIQVQSTSGVLRIHYMFVFQTGHMCVRMVVL